MLVEGSPTGVFAANCYIAATARGAECVVIDPGQDAAPFVSEVVRRHKLRPVAILLTHGHLDHMWSVSPISGTYDTTCWVHPEDRALLGDPMRGLPREWASALLGPGESFAEPDDVRELTDGAVLEVAGLTFVVDHTPGHTSGSVTYRAGSGVSLEVPSSEGRVFDGTAPVSEGEGFLFSGDLLFAGSIGRTDLPGGDHAAMLSSLTDKVLPLADEIVVLPGHGQSTTIGRERLTNPHLRELAPR